MKNQQKTNNLLLKENNLQISCKASCVTGIQRGKGEMRVASGAWVSEFLLPLLAVLAPQANREDTRQTINGSRVHILFLS